MSALSDSASSRRRALQPFAGQFRRVIVPGDRLIATLVVHRPVPWSFSSRAGQRPKGRRARIGTCAGVLYKCQISGIMKEIQADRVWADGQSRGLAHVPAAEENLRADHVRGAACLGPGGDLSRGSSSPRRGWKTGSSSGGFSRRCGVRISRRARALCWTWNTRAPRSQGLTWSRHSVTRALMYDLRRATRWRTTGMSRSP